MSSRKIVIGLDFDGVVAYNPVRILRPLVVFVKKYFFGQTKTHFFIPTSSLEKSVWSTIFYASLFPAPGRELLEKLVRSNRIEAHLVTARFDFMKDHLYRWLDQRGMKDLFTTITVNVKNQQPHEFKARLIRQKKFDYFIEDNLDIVRYQAGKSRTTMCWIYNIFDRNVSYPHKFPYLQKALEHIVALDTFKA